jgi:hypothetical protein
VVHDTAVVTAVSPTLRAAVPGACSAVPQEPTADAAGVAPFTVTTGQGTATYEVESFGTSVKPAPADATNRLVLETASSSLFPSDAVQVSADLVSAPRPNPDDWPDVPADQLDMARDPGDSLVPLTLWSQALLLAVIIATVGVYRWSRWRTYLLMTPVVLALTWCVYENLACLLPNLY